MADIKQHHLPLQKWVKACGLWFFVRHWKLETNYFEVPEAEILIMDNLDKDTLPHPGLFVPWLSVPP